jgi:aquaporin Z
MILEGLLLTVGSRDPKDFSITLGLGPVSEGRVLDHQEYRSDAILVDFMTQQEATAEDFRLEPRISQALDLPHRIEGRTMDLTRRMSAELFGTFWLTFGGCGSAVLAAGFPGLGIGFLGVALAFGLTVLTMAYAVGHVSGGHFNPAVTVGLWSAGRCPSRYAMPYIIAQVIGAIVAAMVLWVIASGHPGWLPGGFAANGYGDLSPGKYGLGSCFIAELVATFFFLFVIIIGSTSRGAAVGFAGIPIGLCLTLIHLVTIPVTNTSVNPARSTGPALFAGGEYIAQLWLFWLAPMIGAVVAGLYTRWLYHDELVAETTPVVDRHQRAA